MRAALASLTFVESQAWVSLGRILFSYLLTLPVARSSLSTFEVCNGRNKIKGVNKC